MDTAPKAKRNARTGRGPLLWGSGIMIVLGVGHLALLAFVDGAVIAAWAERGLWAAVPLDLGGGAEPTAAQLQNSLTFWAGPGSFSVPLVLLGALIRHLVGRGVPVPSWVGWGTAAWCVAGGVLLVPSPYFLGAVAGLLVVLGARRDRLRESAAAA